MSGQVTQTLTSYIICQPPRPWASPVIFVREKDGSVQFCVEYRTLNKITRKDLHSLL